MSIEKEELCGTGRKERRKTDGKESLQLVGYYLSYHGKEQPGRASVLRRDKSSEERGNRDGDRITEQNKQQVHTYLPTSAMHSVDIRVRDWVSNDPVEI